MSILQYPEQGTTKNSTQLHVWNNAAFDCKEELQGLSCSWSDCSKENLSPAALDSSPVSAIKPSCVFLENSQSQSKITKKKKKGLEQEDEKKIEDEIEEIEKEIKRLSSRLEALRLEKAAAKATVEKRGRIVAAKFMEPKQGGFVKKIEEETPKPKVNMMRRGVSLGPAEIASRDALRSRKADIVTTPVPAMQSRRKSCFWKLEEFDEVNERRKSLSLLGKVKSIQGQRQRQRQAATTTTLGSRKCAKKEDEVLALVQPRKLFKEGEKSVPNNNKKQLLKPGRVVASRYNQIGIANQSSVAIDARKRLLSENDKDDYCLKRRASSSVRVKKRWEIPAEVVVYNNEEEEKPSSIAADMMSDVWLPIPKIRTLRCGNDESPRDSGAAKRVAELAGKKSYFCPDNKDVEEASVCQVLSFAEE